MKRQKKRTYGVILRLAGWGNNIRRGIAVKIQLIKALNGGILRQGKKLPRKRGC
jgi:hypothetical protein